MQCYSSLSVSSSVLPSTVPCTCFAAVNCVCDGAIESNKSSSASTILSSSASSTPGSTSLFICSQAWRNTLKPGYAWQFAIIAWRNALNRHIPAWVQHLSSVCLSIAGSAFVLEADSRVPLLGVRLVSSDHSHLPGGLCPDVIPQLVTIFDSEQS
jgi:hypothetical protein